MLGAAGLEVLAEAAEVRRLLVHVAEPDGSAWTDVKWAVKAVKRR